MVNIAAMKTGRKGTVEQHPKLDLRYWQRIKALDRKGFICEWKRPGEQSLLTVEVRPQQDGVLLRYTSGNQREQFVGLVETEVGYGERKWFLCPRCGGQKAILYLKDNFFSCRVCHDLNYASSQAGDDLEYYHWQLMKICDQLKSTYNPMAEFPPLKPRGMHWKRYSRLFVKYRELTAKRNEAFLKMVSRKWNF